MSAQKTKMQYVRLGKSGLKVSKIILGCMSYGNKDWQGWVLEGQPAIDQIKHAWSLGINTFDTANTYSNGESERLLGHAIKEIGAPRERFVILTKVYFPCMPKELPQASLMDPEEHGYINYKGLSRKHIFDSVQASLKRLDVEYIDVLQCHRFDPDTPIEETMQALHDIVQLGWVRYVGMSSCYAWQFHMMQNYAVTNKLTPFISMQNYQNLLYREEEREMSAVCKLFGVGTIPWSPNARGLLSRPRDKHKDTLRAKEDPWTSLLQGSDPASDAIIDRTEEIAKKRGVSMTQIALAWLMQKDPVSAPIIGTTKIEHIGDAIEAVNVKLTEEEIKYLEEPYQPRAIVGHW